MLEDKPYARQMERVTFHRSGKQRRVAQGIALMTLLRTRGQALVPLVYRRQSVPKGIVPCDFRVHDRPAGGPSENQRFREMLQTAHGRGFRPAYARMDSRYASLQNLKQTAALGWRFLTRLKHNRLVNPDGRGSRAVAVPPEGRAVHPKGFGFVRVFRTVSRDGDAEHRATNDLQMEEGKRAEPERQGGGIRALKRCCGVERARVRKAVAILGHLLLALRAFLCLEVYRLRTGVSWYEARAAIARDAIQHYLAHPIHTLQPTA